MFYRVDYRIIERVEEILCSPCKSTVSSRANSSPMGYVFDVMPATGEGLTCARCERLAADKPKSAAQEGPLPVEAAARKFGLMR